MYERYKQFKRLLGNFQVFAGFIVLMAFFYPLIKWIEDIGGTYEEGLWRGMIVLWLADILSRGLKKWDDRIELEKQK